MWSGRFSGKPDKLMQEFSESVSFDKRLWREDIEGSLAYAAELCRIKILTKKELAEIRKGFKQITQEIESGKFEWKVELEDVHMNIESRLTEIIGEAGKKLHTGRSRNDQVATDFKLWCVRTCDDLGFANAELQRNMFQVAERTVDVLIPAYTHMQRAMPVRFAHHLMGHIEFLRCGSFDFSNLAAESAYSLSPFGAERLLGQQFSQST